MPRAETTFDAATGAVEEIIGKVRADGYAALAELARRFDGVEQLHPRVPAAALDEALERLGRHDHVAWELVKLRYYAGLSLEQAAEALGVSSATAYRHWTFGRAWLHGQLLADREESGT